MHLLYNQLLHEPNISLPLMTWNQHVILKINLLVDVVAISQSILLLKNHEPSILQYLNIQHFLFFTVLHQSIWCPYTGPAFKIHNRNFQKFIHFGCPFLFLKIDKMPQLHLVCAKPFPNFQLYAHLPATTLSNQILSSNKYFSTSKHIYS